ncbi:hypothetical protein HH310_38430 [Actinoplanes sp. TBRC 11911]|uniref:hypothetical protein n=1 Tax=Actinoplanes sp. TBRC 11911 TaxID=2729386 RepID=UPI00145C54C6|nr:hypothetical protein [Actinoplanes sp. TBRC 11911]NMO57042.1 hypothetical protein [Actinoplanes sp. TBRC 11911]
MTWPVRFAPDDAYPQVGELRDAVRGRDWAAVATIVDRLAGADRTGLLIDVAATPGLAEPLGESPAGDPTAAALLGFHLVEAAWTVRTDLAAPLVGPRRFRAFHQGLKEAERVLIAGAGRRPDDPAIWTARLATARGLELGQDEAWRRYRRLAAIDPNHLPGQLHMLQQVLPKWGGTWTRAFEFARTAMRSQPPGGPNAVLIPVAHLERWLSLAPPHDQDYIESPAVRQEVAEAALWSVGHPDFARRHGWVGVVSAFAVVFSLQGDHRSAATAFRMLGPLANRPIFGYLGNQPATVVRRYRLLALSPGAGGLTWTNAKGRRAWHALRRALPLVAGAGR